MTYKIQYMQRDVDYETFLKIMHRGLFHTKFVINLLYSPNQKKIYIYILYNT
jgi:hypothetical protein